MAPTHPGAVFRFDDFRYFMLGGDDRTDEKRAALGEKLVAFARAVGATGPMMSVQKKFYGASSHQDDFVNPGEFRKEAFSYWVSLGPKTSRPNCHFTIRIAEDGLALEAFSPFKSWTTTFIEKASQQPRELVAALHKVRKTSAPYHFRLREAYYCDPDSPYKGQCISERVDYLKVHPSVLDQRNSFTLIIDPTKSRLDESTFRPEIFFVRHFPLSEVLDRPDAVEIVANAVGPMIPYFAFAYDTQLSRSVKPPASRPSRE